MTRAWIRSALLLPMLSVAPWGCGGDNACTLVGCDNEAVVTFPAGIVSGPYMLLLNNGSDQAEYGCVDPSIAAENPQGVTCNETGFQLVGTPFAARSSVSVTLATVDGDVIAGPIDVTLQAIETVQPNGPDCEPTCVIRNGRLM